MSGAQLMVGPNSTALVAWQQADTLFASLWAVATGNWSQPVQVGVGLSGVARNLRAAIDAGGDADPGVDADRRQRWCPTCTTPLSRAPCRSPRRRRCWKARPVRGRRAGRGRQWHGRWPQSPGCSRSQARRNRTSSRAWRAEDPRRRGRCGRAAVARPHCGPGPPA
ncbi:MAG: hypothetical protein MZW92_77470 [Comamonadaceae bacterium]|nr:hypothetical protein [Comamonadaceae bacterium]